MARTRAQRRRHTMLLSLALVVTLVFLLFARDISHAAHGTASTRRSENRSFGALANTLLTQENVFDGRLERLLSQGATLGRVAFGARLNQLNGELTIWATTAQLLADPFIAHDVNRTLEAITLERVAAYRTLFAQVARALTLPWSSPSVAGTAHPVRTLVTSSRRWNVDRYALVKEPGLVRLDALSSLSANYVAHQGLTTLLTAPSLAVVRGIGIAALRVSPVPLPAAPGVVLLAPVTSVYLGVSVLNSAYATQPVTLVVRVTPLNAKGAPFFQTLHATVSPLGAYAFVTSAITTAPSEHARLVLTISGAVAAPSMVTTETFTLEMSPSGNG